ncbi:MAG: restriction endonuclease [Chloroflexi bacterium]|nr:restriction endonuclease [Chloroflexota bacterium]
MSQTKVPTFDKLMNPTIAALKLLGGSGTIEEINAKAIETANLSPAQLEILHDPEKGGQTEVEYRLAWARTYLKKCDILENSVRGVWALSVLGKQLDRVNPKEIKRLVREQRLREQDSQSEELAEEENTELGWQEELLDILVNMDASAFERLIQYVLRASGFTQVEVTGRSGDGGVDGKGIMRLGGLLSFHVIFQCKRYRGSVGAGQIRDFRGAMVGRADKGLFVTTGSFTPDANKEANRDGAPPIDLINGEQLIDKLKELSLGVKTEEIKVEKVTINHEWFAQI